MIRIANISLGTPRGTNATRDSAEHAGSALQASSSQLDVSLGNQRFLVSRHVVGRDYARVRQMLGELDGEVDVIAVSGLIPSVTVAGETFVHKEVDALLKLPQATPVVTGQDLRDLYQRWCLRDLARTEPDLLGGRSVGMYMGLLDLEVAPLFEGAARAVCFGDPFLHLRVPTVLNSVEQLLNYARLAAPVLALRSLSSLSSNVSTARSLSGSGCGQSGSKRMNRVDVIAGASAPTANLRRRRTRRQDRVHRPRRPPRRRLAL